MSIANQEFRLKKINDHNKSQNRTLQLQEKGVAAMKGKKVKRFVKYKHITGVTFNKNPKNSEFILHNPKGDLRYKWK